MGDVALSVLSANAQRGANNCGLCDYVLGPRAGFQLLACSLAVSATVPELHDGRVDHLFEHSRIQEAVIAVVVSLLSCSRLLCQSRSKYVQSFFSGRNVEVSTVESGEGNGARTRPTSQLRCRHDTEAYLLGRFHTHRTRSLRHFEW